MDAASPSDHDSGARARAGRSWRGRWFAHDRTRASAADQENEVRERLYARPEPTERTVELVDRRAA
jgi:hypothetical protein